ncbi:CDP-alcohol phosphatidyltransferase family protein [Aliifodinibius salicampi]|uniref:CDP-diacylglycerol--glycerol-3-phosphate 3-phosphatidyltransferase n=1 Tax=Fodinibius salicampi TaxID=1920655 RepID=A0ABT3PVV5_9BACT|nr:CDP-alcohol phosphatidyltransferase family protein [Fodinibius salicampi]MCW9711989.1 CDP-alcohol phosphatidyltransferase family protein [Fodinibius salicampi]
MKNKWLSTNNSHLVNVQRLPNILSTIRLVLAPIFLILYVQDEVVWRALSVGIFAVAVVTDFFDGYLARLYSAQTAYGVFLDPLADKFLTFAGFICLPFIDATQFPWWAVGVIVLRDVVITGMRIIAERRNVSIKTRLTAKIKTMSQMFFLYLVLLVGVFVNTDVWLSSYCIQLLESGILGWLMIAIVVLTLYSGIEYIYVNINIFINKHDAKT